MRGAGGETQSSVMADHAAQPVLPSLNVVERATQDLSDLEFIMNLRRGSR
jgi:hypothetical protein